MERGSNGRIIPLLGAILTEAFMYDLPEVFGEWPRNCLSTLSSVIIEFEENGSGVETVVLCVISVIFFPS
uniref:Similar to PDR8/PEN3 (PLEIOTROPIC DRUG RESISTANCE8) n=1 Tax=Arundo donax TaxID=35708 RepID=A0A0A9G5I3_ARUDO